MSPDISSNQFCACAGVADGGPARAAPDAGGGGSASPAQETAQQQGGSGFEEEWRVMTVRYPSAVLHHEGRRINLYELVCGNFVGVRGRKLDAIRSKLGRAGYHLRVNHALVDSDERHVFVAVQVSVLGVVMDRALRLLLDSFTAAAHAVLLVHPRAGEVAVCAPIGGGALQVRVSAHGVVASEAAPQEEVAASPAGGALPGDESFDGAVQASAAAGAAVASAAGWRPPQAQPAAPPRGGAAPLAAGGAPGGGAAAPPTRPPPASPVARPPPASPASIISRTSTTGSDVSSSVASSFSSSGGFGLPPGLLPVTPVMIAAAAAGKCGCEAATCASRGGSGGGEGQEDGFAQLLIGAELLSLL
ncbi:MAG: hypothetical protein J3K34DRAFT_516004 [Monoraphidium minutum]|nr:MAG: hypothetical protein J3K34DRAFT_516004 [Monoraphidium minutum]